MALAEVAGPAVVSSTGTGTLTTASFTPPAGSLVLALVIGEYGDPTPPTLTISDSTGGTWTQALSYAANLGRVAVFYRIIPAGPVARTVSAAFSNILGGEYLSVRVLTGADPTTPIGGTATYGPASDTSAATFALAVQQAGSYIYGMSVNNATSAAFTPNANTGAMLSPIIDATNGSYAGSWRGVLTPNAGSITYGGTWAATVRNLGGAVEVKAAPTGVPKALAGGIAAVSATSWASSKRPAGSVTGVGVYRRAMTRTVAASSTPTGTKTARLPRTLYGAVFTEGYTQRGYPRKIVGTLTAVGVVGKQSAGRFFYGTITAAGAVRRAPSRLLSGQVTSTGARRRVSALRRAGTQLSQGSPNQVGVRIRAFAGSITSAGIIRRGPRKPVPASVTAAGVIKPRTILSRRAGAVATYGSLLLGLSRRIFGRAGTCEVTVAAAVEMDTHFYLRHRAQVTVELVGHASAGRDN